VPGLWWDCEQQRLANLYAPAEGNDVIKNIRSIAPLRDQPLLLFRIRDLEVLDLAIPSISNISGPLLIPQQT
jgi:hypothetical protein